MRCRRHPGFQSQDVGGGHVDWTEPRCVRCGAPERPLRADEPARREWVALALWCLAVAALAVLAATGNLPDLWW